MILNSTSKINIKSPEFKEYFTLKPNVDGQDVVNVSYANASILVEAVSQLAYILFKGLSEDLDLPIIETPTFIPSTDLLQEMMRRSNID